MTSSTKLEIYNVLRCRQRRTEPRPQVQEISPEFGHVVFFRLARRRTQRSQIQRLQYSAAVPRAKQKHERDILWQQ